MADTRPVLYLMLGYPGAGKTTTAKIIHELTGAEHLWADKVRHEMFSPVTYAPQEHRQLYERLNRQADELLRQAKSVVFDTTFNHYKDRLYLRRIAADAGADTRLVWVQAPRGIAMARATDGAETGGTRVLGNMPPETFEQLAANLEEPRQDEPYVALDGRNITPQAVRTALGL